ncbi:hypothetical protein [Marisediminicola senii]|uniref:hypothetical protein n=1 Tax=Marisediminicola senii TaxID=2711233 RepID=UPI0013EA66E6|nr:hypothetical protein [Marisediminicola senii]
MNTELARAPERTDHPPQPDRRPAERRTGPLDRAALHLGVALIRWGRRPTRRELQRRHAASTVVRDATMKREQLRDQARAMDMTRLR